MRRLLTAVLLGLVLPAAADGADLRAGVGKADITPPTGYPFGGWVRADRTGQGVHTRLYANALVLERDGRKIALVSVDLFAAPGGLVEEVAARLASRGFAKENVLVSASHTHAGPSGFANFATLNSIAPSPETIGDPTSFSDFFAPAPPDPALYTFLVDRIAESIRRADSDRGPAAAGWGQTALSTVTKNRSIEAHLADHGILREFGQGGADEDPEGLGHTIDPAVDVLRVDRMVRRGKRRVRMPMGGWLMFANHGTVNPSTYEVYNNDHNGIAQRAFVTKVRRAGRIPRGREVVGVYGNGNEGDQSAGLDGQGPAVADRVGRAEANAMFAAWRQAGRSLSTKPALDFRWTRVCFCGQTVEGGGRVASEPLPGVPFLTGSEEGRGPLFDVTQEPLEGRRSPVALAPQGRKVGVYGATSKDSYPTAVPLMVVRVRDRIIASLPGEPTVETGRRVRAAVLAPAASAGVKRVIISGLTNEFIQYLTTPEEYDRQHYEGGSTIFGPFSSYLLRDELAELSRRMTAGDPAQEPFAFDARNGVTADGPAFSRGASTGAITAQPRGIRRGKVAEIRWTGGPRGFDRRLDKPFVVVQRRGKSRRWRRVDDDLGMRIVWTVDEAGAYTARWSSSTRARRGVHRIRILANGYRLTSKPFRVSRPKG